MAQQLSVMAVVDVGAALAAGSLAGAYYLVDNNTFGGSTGSGTTDLTTVLYSTQTLNWIAVSVALLDPDLPLPLITNITGEAVDKRAMVPAEYDSPDFYSDGRYWSGTVNPNSEGTYSYRIDVCFCHTKKARRTNRESPPAMFIESRLKIVTDTGLLPPLMPAAKLRK